MKKSPRPAAAQTALPAEPPPDGREPLKSIRAITDLTSDVQNANRGTPRGRALLKTSLRTHGAARSIVADRQGRVIAGNKTLREATALALPVEVIDSAGDKLVVVRRVDLDLETDPAARELALLDNRTTELDLDWDPTALKQHLADGLDLSTGWTDQELEKLLGEGLHPGLTDADRARSVPQFSRASFWRVWISSAS
jgi:hypothetical protein